MDALVREAMTAVKGLLEELAVLRGTVQVAGMLAERSPNPAEWEARMQEAYEEAVAILAILQRVARVLERRSHAEYQ